jgi:hypothetical protein
MPNPPRTLYHGAPRSARDSILKNGLLRSHSETAQLAKEYGEHGWENYGGIFFAENPETTANPQVDVWAVNTDGLTLERDETTDHEHLGERWWVTYSDPVVEPWRLRLVQPKGLREWISLFEKQYVGNCVDAFDRDGLCVADELGWNHTSDFAYAEENAQEISREEFRAAAPHAWHEGRYFKYPNGVYAVYDPNQDKHYFYA